jgi:hypothetical protein
LFDQQPNLSPEPASPPPADNISFESVESFLLQGDEHVLVKTEDPPPQIHTSNAECYEVSLIFLLSQGAFVVITFLLIKILEFLSTNNHTKHATHPPMMIANNNIIFPCWDQPHLTLSAPLEPGTWVKRMSANAWML